MGQGSGGKGQGRIRIKNYVGTGRDLSVER